MILTRRPSVRRMHGWKFYAHKEIPLKVVLFSIQGTYFREIALSFHKVQHPRSVDINFELIFIELFCRITHLQEANTLCFREKPFQASNSVIDRSLYH